MGCTWRPGSDDELAQVAAAFAEDEQDPAPASEQVAAPPPADGPDPLPAGDAAT